MSRAEGVKNKIARKTKRLVEVIGDQALHDQGKEQDQQGREESEAEGGVKPLDKLA